MNRIWNGILDFFGWLFSNPKCPYCSIELQNDVFGGLLCGKCSYDGMTGKKIFE